MGMARHVLEYLQAHELPYEVLPHPHTSSSLETAATAHVPGDRLAKPVILADEQGYLMAVIPATHRLNLSALESQLNRHIEMADESELVGLFEDCEVGAVPPLGPAYGIPMIVDQHIAEQSDIYFEAGDHERLIHMDTESFFELQDDLEIRDISRHL